jgi:hypothetical protein
MPSPVAVDPPAVEVVLGRLRERRREVEVDHDTACATIGGACPDATVEEVEEAQIVRDGAFSRMCQLDERIERLASACVRGTGSPSCLAGRVRVRGRSRPRGRRPGRRRRAVARAGPDDGESDGEGPDVGRRRRGAAP